MKEQLPFYSNPGSLRDVLLVKTLKQWSDAWQRAETSARKYSVIGLDCEWLTKVAKQEKLEKLANDEAAGEEVVLSAPDERVALLQLSTMDGTVIIVQLIHADVHLASELQPILQDQSLLKVGVNIGNDCELLFKHWSLRVMGFVDLRHLYVDWLRQRCNPAADAVDASAAAGTSTGCAEAAEVLANAEEAFQSKARRNGIKVLSKELLGVEVLKDLDVIHSDWTARDLTWAQQNYAALDALASAQIFGYLIAGLSSPGVGEQMRQAKQKDSSAPFEMLVARFAGNAQRLSMCYLNNPFSTSKSKKKSATVNRVVAIEESGWGESHDPTSSDTGTNIRPTTKQGKPRQPDSKSQVPHSDWLADRYKNGFLRRSPLYHNVQLQAPDGTPLAMIDIRKAQWYLYKELAIPISKKDEDSLPVRPSGDRISRDQLMESVPASSSRTLEAPLTVIRLKFEPAGRPIGTDHYYTVPKDNRCVVCGRTDSYLKKHIVPHQYRKFFPDFMKDHRSHDVVLVCYNCHYLACRADEVLKAQLAEECNAPLCIQKYLDDPDRRKACYAARALLMPKAQGIPEWRLRELEDVVREKLHLDDAEPITGELLEETSQSRPTEPNPDYIPHCVKVVETVMNQPGGLVAFERRWRQHFLDSTRPAFLPVMWSLDHNKERYGNGMW